MTGKSLIKLCFFDDTAITNLKLNCDGSSLSVAVKYLSLFHNNLFATH